ncbi:hypothetical protein ECANGB1_2679 [Enterospora canceri]|uniref:Ricin B lectin domain-containing protein n=1 Tax=Enterospora canceri TaxID=1081671 RepID=A0A1Y1S9Q2_9MICR|nr:hypothetical protein ECANGB1_2679 [Enterospora canceri]
MLLALFHTANAFYLLNTQTNEFVGLEGDRFVASGSSQPEQFEIVRSGSNGRLIIGQAYSRNVMDVFHGTYLGTWRRHGGYNQWFELAYTPESSYMLLYRGKCLAYDGRQRKMVLNGCDNVFGAEFKIYYQIRADDRYSGECEMHNSMQKNLRRLFLPKMRKCKASSCYESDSSSYSGSSDSSSWSETSSNTTTYNQCVTPSSIMGHIRFW